MDFWIHIFKFIFGITNMIFQPTSAHHTLIIVEMLLNQKSMSASQSFLSLPWLS